MPSLIYSSQKYLKKYNIIIENARKRYSGKKHHNDGYESHHIIPKSLGGTNHHINLVCLTPREHF